MTYSCSSNICSEQRMSWMVGGLTSLPTDFYSSAPPTRRTSPTPPPTPSELTCSFSMSASLSLLITLHVHTACSLLLCSSPPAPLASFNQINMNSFASFVSALFLLVAVSSCSAFAPSSSVTGGQANAVVRSTRQSSISSSSNLSMIFGPKDDGSPGDYVCLGASIYYRSICIDS